MGVAVPASCGRVSWTSSLQCKGMAPPAAGMEVDGGLNPSAGA